MSGVDKIRDTYSNDAELAKRSTREKFAFIVSNMELLETVDKRGTTSDRYHPSGSAHSS